MGETKKNSKATSILKNNPLTSIVKGNIGIIVVLIIMCVAVALATDKIFNNQRQCRIGVLDRYRSTHT